jgi:hypothetical protein
LNLHTPENFHTPSPNRTTLSIELPEVYAPRQHGRTQDCDGEEVTKIERVESHLHTLLCLRTTQLVDQAVFTPEDNQSTAECVEVNCSFVVKGTDTHIFDVEYAITKTKTELRCVV